MAENDVYQIDQIDSELSQINQITIDSELNQINQISSDIGEMVVISRQYTGVENDLIHVVVDNTIETIEAKSKTYVYQQAVPMSTWNINHNLNKYPSVTVIDSGGDQVLANARYIDANNIILEFSAEFGGTAYLN